jgi:hypothetical protein
MLIICVETYKAGRNSTRKNEMLRFDGLKALGSLQHKLL